MHHLQKDYREYIKTGNNDKKFTMGKYHINTMEIIKLFPVNIFMPITKFPPLAILLFCKKKPFRIFDQFLSLKESTCEARKNVFLFHFKSSFRSRENQILEF